MMKAIIIFSLLFSGLSFFENNKSYYDEVIPNDSKYGELSNIYNNIQLNKAWDLEKGKSSTLVGIIDSGILSSHEDINNVNTNLSYDFSDANNPFYDVIGHGTSVASIIGATTDNNIGVAGINWNVSMVSYKVSHDFILQSDLTTNVALAINKAKEDNVKIINISASLLNTTELYNAIKNYQGLVVCSAGNDILDTDISKHYPSCYDLDNIISVGALGRYDELTHYSNYGKTSVDLFAPGDYIECASVKDNETNYYEKKSGTSFSAPMVTGLAALLLSYNPSLTTSELKNAILNSVDKIDDLEDKCVTGGRLNAYKALLSIHKHNYVYESNENGHTYKCSICDEIKSTAAHKLITTYNSKTHTYKCECGFTTTSNHEYVVKYIDSKCHGDVCVCGYYTNTSPHIIKQSSVSNNKANCLECGAILDLRKDIAFSDGIFDVTYLTLNGSYRLSNGVIVLSDGDYNSYINGTLSFNDDMLLS